MGRRYPNQQRRSRPNRSWSLSTSAVYQTVPAASKVLLGGFSLSNVNIDETILRVVGGISVLSDQAISEETQVGAFGMILVTDAAVSVGITAIPGPVTDGADDGWFVHQSFFQTTKNDVSSPADRWYGIDSKAKRIASEGQQIALVCENFHATHGLVIGRFVRMLSMVRGTS